MFAYVAFQLYKTYNYHFKFEKLKLKPNSSFEEELEQVDLWLKKLEKNHKFNGAILISQNEKPLLKSVYGYADFERKRYLDLNHSFRLASVSKQFTAIGILKLLTLQKLSLDEKVENLIKNFPYKEVTIRHLLNQTSGVPDCYMELAEKHKESLGDFLTIQKAKDLVIKYVQKPKSKPGQIYEYSNTNYILLAALIEDMSGQCFEDFMQKEVFMPLKMKNSRVWNLASKNLNFPKKVDDWENDEEDYQKIEPGWIDGVAGDGAVHSSINDMEVWVKFLFGTSQNFINPDLFYQIFQKPRILNGEESHYGFGMVIEDGYYWHNGSWLGARTYVSHYFNSKIDLVLLNNSSSEVFDKIQNALHEVLASHSDHE